MAAKSISKSQYMMGLQCVKRLWLYNYRKDLMPPIPPDQQLILDQGTEVGKLAHKYFKNGKLVAYDHTQLPQAVEETKELMKNGTEVIYEGTFAFNNVLVRCDVLGKNKNGSWNLIEVKSTTKVHDEHYPDTAIQKYVLEGNGLRVNNVQLMHINNQYVKNDNIDPRGFFSLQDVTRRASEHQREIDKNLKEFMKVLSDDTSEARIEIGEHCTDPYACEFQPYCWEGIPAYSIYDIPWLSWEKINKLRNMGIIKIKDVPDNFALSVNQRKYVKVEQTGQPYIDKSAISDFIEELAYPIYFIDFETISPAIPLYDGSRPYQQIPFQLSLHIQNATNGKLTHAGYLGDGKTDPRPELASFMVEKIGVKGSLMAYNAGFETGIIKEMEIDFPAFKDQLLGMAARVKDLIQPFRQGAYVHPKFYGSCSLKSVLPALCPDIPSYEAMPIANGGGAQISYLKILSGKLSKEEVVKIRQDLDKYCSKDTESMVEILGQLYKTVK